MMLTMNWRQDLRQGFQQDAERAKGYLEAVLEDAAEDGYIDAIVPAVEDVVVARGIDSARSLIESLEAGLPQHREIMLAAISVKA